MTREETAREELCCVCLWPHPEVGRVYDSWQCSPWPDANVEAVYWYLLTWCLR